MAGKSSRELRREQERKDRHEQKMAQIKAVSRMSTEQYIRMVKETEAIAKIQQNGITLKELKENYGYGYQDGYKAGSKRKIEPIMKLAYAAAALSLNELHGFSTKRIEAVLKRMDEKIIYALTSDELVDEVMDKFGIEIDFDSPFAGDRVESR